MSEQQHACAYPGCRGEARWHAEARDGGRRAEVRVCELHLAYLHCQGKLGDYRDMGTGREYEDRG